MVTLTYTYQLSNNKGKSFLFYHASGLSENISVNSISFNMPGQTSKDNINLNLGGFTKILSFNFMLRDTGFDVADGDGIVTLFQQWNYLMGDEFTTNSGMIEDDSISGNTTDVEYYIRIAFENSNGTASFKYYTGMVEDISIEPTEGEPILRGRLSFRIGGQNPFKLTES